MLVGLEGNLKEEETILKQMSVAYREIYQQNSSSIFHLIIGSYIALAANDQAFFATNESKFRENTELLYLYIVSLLKNLNIEGAEAKLIELRRINDEDILTLLATINVLVNFWS